VVAGVVSLKILAVKELEALVVQEVLGQGRGYQ